MNEYIIGQGIQVCYRDEFQNYISYIFNQRLDFLQKYCIASFI